jgi:hypothetical protein
MAKAQVIGGPDDGLEVNIDAGKTYIDIYQNGANWRCPIRNGRIYWNERVKQG